MRLLPRCSPKILLMALIGLGCDRGTRDLPAGATSAVSALAASAPTAAARGPAQPLVMKVGGKVVPIRSRMAFSRGGETIRVELSGAELSCDDLRHGGRMLDEGEQPLTLELAPTKGKDGSLKWQVVSASFDRVTRRGKLAEVQMLASDVRGEVRARTSLSFVVPANDISKQHKMRSVTLAGEIVATGCGLIPPSAVRE